MAHTKSAKKSIRIIAERRSRNRAVKGALKSCTRKAEGLVLSKEREPAEAAVKQATIALDKAVRKGVLHANNAARHKSRLMKKLNAAFASEG